MELPRGGRLGRRLGLVIISGGMLTDFSFILESTDLRFGGTVVFCTHTKESVGVILVTGGISTQPTILVESEMETEMFVGLRIFLARNFFCYCQAQLKQASLT